MERQLDEQQSGLLRYYYGTTLLCTTEPVAEKDFCSDCWMNRRASD